MRFLLDTHVLLWALFDRKRIGPSVSDSLASPENAVQFSAASIWEIAIKNGLGKLDLSVPLADVLAASLEMGFEELPVRAATALRVASLPKHHADPFDRLLIAQAMDESATLLTADANVARYSDIVSIAFPR